jgi:hypothetical protein
MKNDRFDARFHCGTSVDPRDALGAVRAVEFVEVSELEISGERECHDQVAGNSDAAVPLSISHTRRFTS